MGVNKIIGGMWTVMGGAAGLIVIVLFFNTPEAVKKVPQSFVCVPESLDAKVKAATIVMTGSIEGVLPGSPYADVWVKPSTVYQGAVKKFVRFAAWPKKGNLATIGDLHFQTGGTTYLWFFRPLKDGTLTTSSCYGTHVLPKSGLTDAEQALLVR